MSTLDSTHAEDPWSTFRLPVPLAKHANGTKCPFELPSYCSDEWIQRLTDLLRLLDVMKKTPISQERASTMKSQMVLARSMMDTIECYFVPCLNDHRTAVDKMEEHELNFHANIEVLLNELRRGTRDVCQTYQDSLDRWKSMHLVKPEKLRDFIAEIFLLPEDQSPLFMTTNHDDCLEDEFFDDVLGDSDGSHEERKDESSAPQSALNHKNAARRHQASSRHPPKELDPVEFQKQQQHLLEEELSTLASRLKSSTLAMNATLQSQTRDLEDFESLAQENLDVVSSTTQKVQDHLIKKKGWKKSLATWSLIATVVGMWVFCFMVIRTVPKRKIGTFSFYKWRRKSSSRDDDEYVRENTMAEAERRRWDMWREREKMHKEDRERRWKQQQQQQRQQPGYQQQSQQQQREHCEILSDGTQVCSDAARKFNFKDFSNSDRMAQQLLAERKRNRIEENMANAPLVNAIDSVDNDESEDAAAAAAVAAAEENEQREESQRRDAAKQAAEVHRRHVEKEARDANIKASAGEKEQAEEAERHRRIEQEVIMRSEAEARAEAEEIAEAKRHQKEQEEAERLRLIEEETRLRKEAEERAAEEAAEAERRQKERDAKAAEERAAAEEMRRLEEAERLRQIEEETRLKKEAEERAAEEAADAKRLQKEGDAKAAEERAAAEEKRRLEEAERLRQIEEETRLRKEAEDRAAEEAAEAERRQKEREAKAAEERAAAEAKRRLEEAERLRQIEEVARLKKEAKLAAAAAAEKERLERERLEAIKREKLLAEVREKENIERVRKESLEEANEALQLAKHVNPDSNPTGILPSDIRFVAGRGKNDLLAHYITTRPDMVDASDGSGWRPIHEAARGGNRGGVQLLIDSGCDLSARTGRGGNGGTALWWAIQRYGEEHDVVRLLRSYGAPADGPDS